MRLASSSLLSLLLPLVASPSAAQDDSARVIVGDVLVGVDALGRVLVAVDSMPTDGLADTCFIYTASERLSGPWSRMLSNARVVHKKEGSLSIEAAPPDFVVLLSTGGAEPPDTGHPPESEVFEVEGGLELAVMEAGPSGGAPLLSMRHDDLETWPEGFWYDLLDPASGPCPDDSDCTAGGQGTSSCSIDCGIVGCSVTCWNQDEYSCCKCLFLMCRCRPCITGP